MHRLLVINPGSTSTKVAVFQDEQPLFVETLCHPAQALGNYAHVLDQYDFRLAAVREFLQSTEIALSSLSAVVGRGGLLQPVPSGTYLVDEAMIAELQSRDKEREHASSLGALLSYDLAQRAGLPAYIVDPVCVDEFDDIARVSGLPDIERRSLSHALNLKAVARRAAADMGTAYTELNLVVVHLGGGISVTAHRQGRMVDVNQALDGGGPFAPERAGGLPVGDVVRMCFGVGSFAGLDISYEEMFKKLAGQGGLVAHLGTNSAIEVERRIESGDKNARLIYEAMSYQIAKEIGAMSTVLNGDVDAIVITGGVAHSDMLMAWIEERVEWIAPIRVYPGEDELLALAQGALRVLRGDEVVRVYSARKCKSRISLEGREARTG